MDLNRLGISGITTNNWTLEEDIYTLKKHELKNLGLWLYKCQNKSSQQIRRILEGKDISISNVCFAGMFTGDTEESRRTAIQQTKDAVDFTKEIGAGCLLLVSGPIGGHTYDQALSYVKEGLKDVCEYVENKNVHLGLEALHPMAMTDHSILNKLETVVSLVDEIDSDYLGVFLDTYNIGWDSSYLHWIPKCERKIKGVHIADWRNPTRSLNDRVLPGQGVLPVSDIIQLIEQTGYTGSYDLEIFSDELWEADYHSIIHNVKEWFSDVI